MAKTKSQTRNTLSQPRMETTRERAGRSRDASARAHAKVNPTAVAASLPFPYKLVLAALCLLLAISPIFLSNFAQAALDIDGGGAYVPQMMFMSVTACTCLIAALWPPISGRNVLRSMTPSAWMMVAFLLWCALSVSTTVYLHDSLLEIARIAACVAWFFLARSLLTSYTEREAAWRHLLLLGSVSVAAVIIAIPAVTGFVGNRDPRQFSYFYNPNLFANYCAMAFPLTLAWPFLLRRYAATRTPAGTPSALVTVPALLPPLCALVGLALTSSKGGMLALVAGFLTFAIAVVAARRQAVMGVVARHRLIVIVALLIVVLAGGFVFKRNILPRLNEGNNSTMFRKYTWESTLHMAQARPVLGWGPGSFPVAYFRFAIADYTRTAHQLWLQIAAESGWPALLLLLGACGYSVVRGARALRGRDWPVASAALGSLGAFIVHGLTDAGWSIVSIALLFCIVLALLDTVEVPLAATTAATPKSDDDHQSSRSNLRWPWLGVALVFAVAAALTQRAVNAEDLNFDARLRGKEGNIPLAQEKAERAAQTDPLDGRVWLTLGRLREAQRDDAEAAYRRAMAVQPTNPRPYFYLAQHLVLRNQQGDEEEARRLFDRAMTLHPNDSEMRLARGDWLLQQKDPAAWKDFEFVEQLADQPYGLYPATPQFVNLDFARARSRLAAHLLGSKQADDKARACKMIEAGLRDVALAKTHEDEQETMARELGSDQFAPDTDLDALEEQLKKLENSCRENQSPDTQRSQP